MSFPLEDLLPRIAFLGVGGSSWTMDGMLLFLVFFNVLLARLLWLGKALGVHSSQGESPDLQNVCCFCDAAVLEFLISGKPEMLGTFFRSDQPGF